MAADIVAEGGPVRQEVSLLGRALACGCILVLPDASRLEQVLAGGCMLALCSADTRRGNMMMA